MNVTETLNVTIDEESFQALADGTPLQVPIGDGQELLIHPPRSRAEQQEDTA